MTKSTQKRVRYALITGASSGLGAEYARQLARRKVNLVLVARDLASLNSVADSLTKKYGVETEVIVADLLNASELNLVKTRIGDEHKPIDLLINNAGFGLPLSFDTNSLESEIKHLHLHVEVPMQLMHEGLQHMVARKNGIIINVASVAAFIPRGTYSAVKQWLVTFSRWANRYYKSSGVTVNVVCPGFTHTNFHERMGLAPGREGVANWMWLEAPKVVAESLRTARKGKAVTVPSFKYKALVFLTRLLPSSVGAKVGERGR